MKLSRQDFLKISSVLSLSSISARLARGHRGFSEVQRPNVLLLLFDTLSARHLSLHGYRRETTPHMKNFAERATVFQRHISPGSFTTIATSSILTGVYPWSHRAFQFYGVPLPVYSERNIFSLLAADYHDIRAFSQNLLVNQIIQSMELGSQIQDVRQLGQAALYNSNDWTTRLFHRDYIIEQHVERKYTELKLGYPISPLLAELVNAYRELRLKLLASKHRQQYPNGLPYHPPFAFSLADTMDWIAGQINTMTQPFFGYYHLIPPHEPYVPSVDFEGIFDDSYLGVPKPEHHFSDGWSQEELGFLRRKYDQYIANVDAEFGRLVQGLEQQGVLDNTILILTSDHGELFERGIWAHNTPTLYQPVIQVPLMIHTPGQKENVQVKNLTSNVDLLPTILHLCGYQIPSWIEGQVLPPWGILDESRPVFAMDAKTNPVHQPLHKATFTVLHGNNKMVRYMGYEGFKDRFELYNLHNDPEELHDLSGQSGAGDDLFALLHEKLDQINQPYTP